MAQLICGPAILQPMEFKDRLRVAREGKGLTQGQLAKLLRVRQSAVSQWERGETIPNPRKNHAIAEAVGVDVPYLFQGVVDGTNDKKTVPLRGTVGPGGQVFPVDEQLRGEEPETVPAPPHVNVDGVVAVKVLSESMAPAYFPGNIIYYGLPLADPSEGIGQEVVTCTADNAILVRRLAPGRKPGCFDLISYSGAIQNDVPVKWVALIIWVKKR